MSVTLDHCVLEVNRVAKLMLNNRGNPLAYLAAIHRDKPSKSIHRVVRRRLVLHARHKEEKPNLFWD